VSIYRINSSYCGEAPAFKPGEALLARGANIECLGSHGEPPLHYAIRNHRADIVRELLARGAHCNAGGINNERPLHIAFKEHDDLILSVLLQCQNLRIEAIDALGNMALHCAALCISMEPAIVQEVIVRTPADKINVQNEKGDTALIIAIRARNESFALALLACPEINLSLCNAEGNSALHVAAAIANPLLSQGLIDALATRADARALNKQQVLAPHNTALSIAIHHNNIGFVRRLLAHPSIQPNFSDTTSKTPLHVAIEMGRAECILALIAYIGIELNAPDRTGNTPAHYAIVAGTPLVLRNALLTAPSVIYSIQGADRVDDASRSPSLPLDIQLAIARRADLRLSNINGNNPIHIAAQIGGIDHRLVQRLAENTTYREAIHTFNFCSQLPCDLSRNAIPVVKKLITPYLPTRCLLRSKNYFFVHADSQNPSRVEFPAAAATQHAEHGAAAAAQGTVQQVDAPAAAAQGTVQQADVQAAARVAGQLAQTVTEKVVSAGLSKITSSKK